MELKKYPKEIRQESGSKIGWLYYKSKAKALEASEIAKHNAEIKTAKGFDFGYQSPGDVRECENGDFVVIIP